MPQRGTLRLGVTGHRMNRLKTSAVPVLLQRAGTVLAACEACQAQNYELLSAVAEGADRIVAHAALSRHWKLVVPLPFTAERYEQDFKTQASRLEFKKLLAAAHDVRLPQETGHQSPYEAAGQTMVLASHGLIAVWNGQPAAGRGGTANVIAMMLESGGPVAWIHSENEYGIRLIPPFSMSGAGSYKRRLFDVLSQHFEITEPPDILTRPL